MSRYGSNAGGNMRRLIRATILLALVLAGGTVVAKGSSDVGGYELMGTAYVIDGPRRWTASREVMYDKSRMVCVLTVITEVAADQDLGQPATGYRLTMDHMQMRVMSPALGDGLVLSNLLQFYQKF